jgi:uncharacterized phiE125 gp8 family phage protein
VSYRLILVTPPQSEPVSLAEAKDHLRETSDEQDSLIGSLIVAARMYVEQITGRALISQTWRMELDCFPEWKINVPRPKLVSVSSLTYVATDGTVTTIAADDYTVTVGGEHERGFVVPAYQNNWPTCRDVPSAVKLTFVAGYASAEDVPEPIKHYIKLMIGSMYAHRETEITGTIQAKMEFCDALITPYRIFAF